MREHRIKRAFLAVIAALCSVAAPAQTSHPTDHQAVRVLATRAIRESLDAVLSHLQAVAQRPVVVEYGSAKGNLKEEILRGKEFDLAILLPDVNEQLFSAGKIQATTYDLATVETAIGVRGKAALDVRTPANIKRALLGAKSVEYSPTGTGVATVRSMIAALGLTGKINDTSNVEAEVALQPGEYEVVFYPLSEMRLKEKHGLVTNLGPLPNQFQVPVVIQASVSAQRDPSEATRAIIQFLAGPGFGPALEASGMTPSGVTNTFN
jgi:molybdate transport system substrate-binding protein